LGGGGYFAFKKIKEAQPEKGTRLRTDTAEVRDLESVVTATGEVMPLLSSIVKSEISGRIERILVEEGDEVKRGQTLMELDPTSLQTQVNEAERSLEAEQLRLDKSKRNYERLKELYDKEFVGEQDYLDAQTDYDLAKLNLEIAQSRLEDAQEDLSKTVILAPHDGVLTLVDVVEGEVISGATSVSNGTELMTIAQLNELYMEANINEVDVERLSVGQTARLTFDAIPDYEIEGQIGEIALSARRDGDVRVFPIEVIFSAEDNRVRPGISATVDIPINSVEDAVSVLLSAVFFTEDDNETLVYVKENESWKPRNVSVGINNLQYAEIKSGLEVGEVVALSRPAEYRDGDE
jgi:RND family efflux transporter MFP subunit